MKDERLRTAQAALRCLGAEIVDRRRELAILERAFDTIESAIEGGDTECDLHADLSACGGGIFVEACRECGAVIRRCQAHGGLRSAALAAKWHRYHEHDGAAPNRAQAEDTGRVSRGGPAVPMGLVPSPPTPRGQPHRRAHTQPGDDDDDEATGDRGPLPDPG